MRERGEGERGEWEWDKGGLGRALGGEPSVGLSRRKGKPRPIPVGGGREERWVRRGWKWCDRVGAFVVVVEGRGYMVWVRAWWSMELTMPVMLIRMNFPNRLELLFRCVCAFLNASRIGFA